MDFNDHPRSIAAAHAGLDVTAYEQCLQAVLDNVSAAVFIKDFGGRYLFINQGYAQRFSLDEASIAGKTDHDLFPRARADALRAYDHKVIETRRPWEGKEVIERDGETRVYHSRKFPLFDASGAVYAVCGVYTDVTEICRAEHELYALRRQMWHSDRVARAGVIIASITHELNQPLAAIMSNAQAALRFLDHESVDLTELRAILQDVVRDDKRAAAVISGLRALLRRQETPREELDLANLAAETLDILHGEFVLRNIKCKCHLDHGIVVCADKAQIQQVMLNLVMNAMEVMNDMPVEQRRLRMSVEPDDGGRVRMTVRDSGEGIPAAQLDGVFDAFYTTKAQGLGMGLAVCRSIIEAHGGAIWVERNDDCGVTFFVTLPGRVGAAKRTTAEQESGEVA